MVSMKGEINMFSLVMDENELKFFENLLEEIRENNKRIKDEFENVISELFNSTIRDRNNRYKSEWNHYIKNVYNILEYKEDYYGYNESICDIVDNYIRSYNYYLRFRKCKVSIIFNETKDGTIEYKCIRYSFYKEDGIDEDGVPNLKKYFSYDIDVSEFNHINVVKWRDFKRNGYEFILNDVTLLDRMEITDHSIGYNTIHKSIMDLIKFLNEILFKLDNDVAKQIPEAFKLNYSLTPDQLKEYEEVVSQLPDELNIYWGGTNNHHHFTSVAVIPIEDNGIEKYNLEHMTFSPAKDIKACIILESIFYMVQNRYYIPKYSGLMFPNTDTYIMNIKPDRFVISRSNLTEANKYVPKSYFKCEIDISCIPLDELKYLVNTIVDKYKKLAE